MIELFGHFHPLLVHLPIGIIMTGLLLQWLASKPRFAGVKAALPVIFLAGTLTAVLSSITGYLLSISDDYDQALVNWHMWSAIGLIVTSAVLYTKHANPKVALSKKWLGLAVLFLVALTGHFGGSLTHGSDYLSKPFANVWQNDSTGSAVIRPLANVQEAVAYSEVIQPVLRTKCYSCHNAGKQKGGLRMDDFNLLMKGGKNGVIINRLHIDSSELLRRILLPTDHEDHMPPKEKPQPTESQVALLRWWIAAGANPIKKVKELDQPERIQPLLAALQQPVQQEKVDASIPPKPVDAVPEKVLEEVRRSGVIILPVAKNSNYLSASFSDEIPVVSLKQLAVLQQVHKQLIWLKLNGKQLPAGGVASLSKLTNLTRLNLSYSTFIHTEVQQLASLQNLSYLNLVGTPVTRQDISALKSLNNLQSLYLYQTAVASREYAALQLLFPRAIIDTGNYHVPLLVTDTTLVKAAVNP